jgi:hypothetical protein
MGKGMQPCIKESMDGGGHEFVSMQSFSAKNQVQSLDQPVASWL